MLTSGTRGETLTPNLNKCNSTLTSGTNNIYPYPYLDINDRSHRLRITHTRRRQRLVHILRAHAQLRIPAKRAFEAKVQIT